MKIRYCPECGRSIPLDARICPYCAKTIPLHDSQFTMTKDPPDFKLLLIVVIVVCLVPILVTIAISATVYVYTSGMIGVSPETTPTIYFVKNDFSDTNTLTVAAVSSSLSWSEIQMNVNGSQIDHGLSGSIIAGDVIDLSAIAGNGAYHITIIHTATNTLMASYDFTTDQDE